MNITRALRNNEDIVVQIAEELNMDKEEVYVILGCHFYQVQRNILLKRRILYKIRGIGNFKFDYMKYLIKLQRGEDFPDKATERLTGYAFHYYNYKSAVDEACIREDGVRGSWRKSITGSYLNKLKIIKENEQKRYKLAEEYFRI